MTNEQRNKIIQIVITAVVGIIGIFTGINLPF